jgi:hypothetical protein
MTPDIELLWGLLVVILAAILEWLRRRKKSARLLRILNGTELHSEGSKRSIHEWLFRLSLKRHTKKLEGSDICGEKESE